MAVARFLDVFKEETTKMKENADNHLSNFIRLFASGSLNIVE